MFFLISFFWNQTTPLGYSVETFVGVSASAFYFFFDGLFLLLFISLCFQHQAFYEIFAYSMHKMDITNNQQQKKLLLSELVEFHVTVKKYAPRKTWSAITFVTSSFYFSWFFHTSKVFGMIILVQLIFSTIVLALIIFQLDLVSMFPFRSFS